MFLCLTLCFLNKVDAYFYALDLSEYRTVSGVAGPLVILEKVKVNILLLVLLWLLVYGMTTCDFLLMK